MFGLNTTELKDKEINRKFIEIKINNVLKTLTDITNQAAVHCQPSED